MEPGQCGCGIPDVDPDGDGVATCVDNCADAPNPDQLDSDEDGAGDACDPCPLDPEDDADGDNVCAPLDGCPYDPQKVEPGQCGCGESDHDSDGDTVADCIDVCPGLDDTIDGNGDGTPDCIQVIPTVSEWGLAVLTLVLLTAGKIFFGRGRAHILA